MTMTYKKKKNPNNLYSYPSSVTIVDYIFATCNSEGASGTTAVENK